MGEGFEVGKTYVYKDGETHYTVDFVWPNGDAAVSYRYGGRTSRIVIIGDDDFAQMKEVLPKWEEGKTYRKTGRRDAHISKVFDDGSAVGWWQHPSGSHGAAIVYAAERPTWEEVD